jgi:hypothetical protein
LENNHIFGYYQTGAFDLEDFVEFSQGILVEQDTDFHGESSDLVCVGNKIYGFRNSAIVDGVEAVTFYGRNDIQACFRGPIIKCSADLRMLNQIYFVGNHVAVSGDPTTFERMRQLCVMGNQFDYAQGRTDTATLSLLRLDSAMRGVIIGNTFRAGSSGSVSVYGVELEETHAATPVVDMVVTGNKFEDLSGVYRVLGDPSGIARITDYGNMHRDAGAFCTPPYAGVGPFIRPTAGNGDNLAYLSDTVGFIGVGAEETLPTSTGTVSLIAANNPQLMQYFASTGTGSYTRNIDLRIDGANAPQVGYRMAFIIRFSLSSNAIVRFRNGLGGDVISTTQNLSGVANLKMRVDFVFDGVDWVKVGAQPYTATSNL